MEAWLGQYCINVTDLDATVRFYETLGLANTSRTEIPQAFEAIVEDAGGRGGKIQLAQQHDHVGPIDHGNAFWKLYINTNDIDRQYRAAMDAGYKSISSPEQQDRWPVTVAYINDPDGYTVELVQRHPWPDTETYAWAGQYCIYVNDIDQAIKFYETAGLACTSQTDIPGIREAIVENPTGRGGKLQLAQKLDDTRSITMGSAIWKLYVNTDDCDGLHATLTSAGYREIMAPQLLERWNTTMSYVNDPDGYQVELVTLAQDRH